MTNVDLPEEVLEFIISKLPFPDIFKARILSRSWLVKLSAISGKEDEASRFRTKSFHRLVGESSQKWRTFYAVWFGEGNRILHPSLSTSHCFGPDWTSRRWQKLPSLDFLPINVELHRYTLQMEGALLYGCAREFTSENPRVWLRNNWSIFVANVLTRTWKNLPPRPNAFDFDHPRAGYKVQSQKLVSQKMPGELPGYKMITIGAYFLQRRGHLQCDHYSAQIYFSNSNRWITKKIISAEQIDRDANFSTIAYVNGVLYMMETFIAHGGLRDLLAFSIEEGTVKIYNLSPVNFGTICGTIRNILECRFLVARNTTLMLVLTDHSGVSVFEVDLKPIPGLFEVTHLNRLVLGEYLAPLAIEAPISIGSCLYFTWEHRSRTIMPMFDVEKGKWSSLTVPELLGDSHYSYKATCFQPGLNPFMTV